MQLFTITHVADSVTTSVVVSPSQAVHNIVAILNSYEGYAGIEAEATQSVPDTDDPLKRIQSVFDRAMDLLQKPDEIVVEPQTLPLVQTAMTVLTRAEGDILYATNAYTSNPSNDNRYRLNDRRAVKEGIVRAFDALGLSEALMREKMNLQQLEEEVENYHKILVALHKEKPGSPAAKRLITRLNKKATLLEQLRKK